MKLSLIIVRYDSYLIFKQIYYRDRTTMYNNHDLSTNGFIIIIISLSQS